MRRGAVSLVSTLSTLELVEHCGRGKVALLKKQPLAPQRPYRSKVTRSRQKAELIQMNQPASIVFLIYSALPASLLFRHKM